MQRIVKVLLSISLGICLILPLSACGNNKKENWLSPMMSVSLDKNKLSIYDGFELSTLNAETILPAALADSNAVTKANLQLAYKGDGSYKVRINVRIDEVKVEEDGSIGHSVTDFGVSKSHVTVLFYADETWFDSTYGSNVASGGDTLFDSRYYTEQDAEYSTTRRALLFNKETAQNYSSIDFYIIGLIDGYYVLNFYIEAADSHGHFHGINKLALTSALITVGTPVYQKNGGGTHEH